MSIEQPNLDKLVGETPEIRGVLASADAKGVFPSLFVDRYQDENDPLIRKRNEALAAVMAEAAPWTSDVLAARDGYYFARTINNAALGDISIFDPSKKGIFGKFEHVGGTRAHLLEQTDAYLETNPQIAKVTEWIVDKSIACNHPGEIAQVSAALEFMRVDSLLEDITKAAPSLNL